MTPEHEAFLDRHYRELAREEKRAEEYNRRMGIEPDVEPEPDEDEE